MGFIEILQKLWPPPLRQPELKEYTEEGLSARQMRDLYRKMRAVESPRPELIRPLVAWLEKSIKLIPKTEPIKILNLATGHGGLEDLLANWAEKKDLNFDLTGVDMSDIALEVASEVIKGRPNIHFKKDDVRHLTEKDDSFHFVISNNLVHHLSKDELQQVLKEALRIARYGIYCLDPLRCRWGIRVVGFLARHEPLIQHEAVISYRRSFVPEELQSIVKQINPRLSVQSEFPWFLSIQTNLG